MFCVEEIKADVRMRRGGFEGPDRCFIERRFVFARGGVLCSTLMGFWQFGLSNKNTALLPFGPTAL